MNANLRIFLTGMLLTCSLLACTDHRLRPLSPLNLRLKTVEKVGGLTTTFTYGQGNRVESYSRSNGDRGLFSYDAQSRYSRYEIPSMQNPGLFEYARFTYYTGSNAFDVGFYTSNGASENNFETLKYTVDGNKHITGFSNGGSTSYRQQTYQYTGDNITTAIFTVGRTQETRVYEFDNKPNTYYGLIVPGVEDFLTYSRNNVTKETYVAQDGRQIVTAEYVYEYNAQGLPTKVTNKDGSGEVRFTYESY